MKDILLKTIKFLGKVLLKIIKIVFLLPLSAYMLSKTYDVDELEENINEITK